MSERATLSIRSARLTLDFLPVAAYGLSRNPKDQKSKYTSILVERHVSCGNTAVPVIWAISLKSQSRMSRTSTLWLVCTEYRLVPCLPSSEEH